MLRLIDQSLLSQIFHLILMQLFWLTLKPSLAKALTNVTIQKNQSHFNALITPLRLYVPQSNHLKQLLAGAKAKL